MKLLTAERCCARACMYDEAAAHLEQDVTDNPIEKREAHIVSRLLFREATKWHKRAHELEPVEESE